MTVPVSAPLRAACFAFVCALGACTSPAPVPASPPAPAAPAAASATGVAPQPPRALAGTDYGQDAHWLCRPGRKDACAQPLTDEPGARNGSRPLRPDPAAPIDCFYVYPTISFDPGANSDLDAGPEERRVAQHQLAAFGSVCRTFAPMYRQVTLAAVRSLLVGGPIKADAAMAYGDVRDAWNDYLARDNQGRGVVLIGHSQGARMLAELLAREIEGKPVQRQIVSAILLGANLAVPKGRDVGGAFKTVPLCRSTSQTGCVVAYTTFRADAPPPADTLFGRIGASAVGGSDPAAFSVACTNPAALGGGKGALAAWLPVRENLLGQPAASGIGSESAFMSRTLPDAQCVETDGVTYLSVPLPADVPGDLIINGQPLRNWGLHLVDVNVATDSLVEMVRQQARSHAAPGARR